jgi:hypothetical protein
MKEIELTQGRVARVDDVDFHKLAGFRWHLHNKGYAARGVKAGEQTSSHLSLMHREITNAPKGWQVDHINGDRLDNRRENLRLATRSQNQANSLNPRNSSGFRGVSPRNGRWVAQTKHLGRYYSLGTFDNPEDAARAYDKAAVRLHGQFARLNFPEVVPVAVAGLGFGMTAEICPLTA